ncbi:MAG: P1 family peptidase [Bacillota bacterium]|nr:P1 family peptidase [Bacillota bacterium]
MKKIQVSEMNDFKIGHYTDLENGTGCSVILCEQGAIAGVDVRGGWPATRETDLLDPKNMVQQIHAVTLSGGSAYGLEASCGVMEYLGEHKIGFDMKGIYIPIVCQASLFDCGLGTVSAYPHKEHGYYACQHIQETDLQGCIGAGTGASVGKFLGFDKAMKTGLGQAAFEINGLQVGAIVALNACGDLFFPNSNKPIATCYDAKEKKRIISEEALLSLMEGQASCGMNTTIGCILTNAKLNKAEMNKLASMSHNAYAHCIRPVHTPNDGDTIFTMSTGKVEANLDIVSILANKAMEQALVNAGIYAQSLYGLPSYKEIEQD